MDSYRHFLSVNRAFLKKVEPNLKGKKLVRKLQDKWVSLSKDEKKKFDDLASKDSLRYAAEKRIINPQNELSAHTEKVQDPKAVSKPLS